MVLDVIYFKVEVGLQQKVQSSGTGNPPPLLGIESNPGGGREREREKGREGGKKRRGKREGGEERGRGEREREGGRGRRVGGRLITAHKETLYSWNLALSV